jgi:hypothetical protein
MTNPQTGGTTGNAMTGQIRRIMRMRHRHMMTMMDAANVGTIQRNIAVMANHAPVRRACASRSLPLTVTKAENCMRFRRKRCSTHCSGSPSTTRTPPYRRRLHDPPRRIIHDDDDDIGVLSWLQSVADSNKVSESSLAVVPVAWIGRTSTEDKQDPTLSLPRQLEKARLAHRPGHVLRYEDRV